MVPVRYEPKFESPPISAYTAHTLKDAGLGALGGAALGAIAGCALGFAFGPLGIVLCPYLAGIGAAGGAAGGGVLGAAGGAVEGAPSQETRTAKAAVAPTATSMQLQLPLAEAVRSAAETATGRAPEVFSHVGPTSPHQRAEYASLAKQGIDTVLETSVIRFGFDSAGGKDPDVALFMIARARLVDAATGRQLWAREFAYLSRYAGLPTWAAEQSRLLKGEYERAHHALAERVVEEVFLVTVPSRLDTTGQGAGEEYATCGLRGSLPKVRVLSSTVGPEHAFVVGSEVNSLLPTLQWDAFTPPASDTASQTPTNDPITAVRYDLKIWQATSESTVGELAYERYSITATSHTLTRPLEPGNTYLWSVRGRYPTSGAIYATRWGQSRLPLYARRTALLAGVFESQRGLLQEMQAAGFDLQSPLWSPCAVDFIPDANYYRFTTPPPPHAEGEKRAADSASQQSVPSATQTPAAVKPAASQEAVQPFPAAQADAASIHPKIGDRWIYQLSDRGRVRGMVDVEIVETSATSVKERITRQGYPAFMAERQVEAKFNPVRFQPPIDLPGGYPLWEFAPYLPLGTQLSVGQSWGPISGVFYIPAVGKRKLAARVSVVGVDKVRVPAGEFDAWRVETEPLGSFADYAVIKCRFWYSPQSLRTIKMQFDTVPNAWGQPTSEIYELSRFEAAK